MEAIEKGVYCMKAISLIPLAIFLIPFVLAGTITCNPSSISIDYIQGQNASTTTICVSTNSTNSTYVSLSGTGSGYIISDTSVMSPSATRTINLSFFINPPIGNYSAFLNFSEGTSVPVSFQVMGSTLPEIIESNITVFPTSKVVSVQQGSQKTQNIIISVPQSYPRTVTVQAVDFNPGTDTILFGDLNLGQVVPGSSILVPIIFDGTNAQTGTYQTDLNIFAYDSKGNVRLPKVSLTLQVTVGITPTNGTFTQKPVCSLSSANLNLNETAEFTCNNVVNNLDVVPQYNSYLEGLSASVSSGVYKYVFKPIKYGNTNFTSLFSYRGSPLFSLFSQEIRISASGSSLGGTDLKFSFTPSLKTARPSETIILQLVDNKTNSLVGNPEIYMNSLILTNKTGDSFFIVMEFDRQYEMRGRSLGYNDLVQTIRLESQDMKITIDPIEGDSYTLFNITTQADNVSLFIDGVKVIYPFYNTLSGGEHQIRAIKEGYFEANENLTVLMGISGTFAGEFEEGVIQVMQLNKNTTWEVRYKKSADDSIEVLKSGDSDKIEFTPNSKGIYEIYADNRIIDTREIGGFNWGAKWLGLSWYWWIIGIIALLFIVFAFDWGGGSESPALSPKINYG